MLAIRMQRTGRKGYASFRVVVQDSRFAPNSGRVVAKLGHHNPHTKETVIDKEKAQQYLTNGAQPSPRVVRLFTLEKVALPAWVEKPDATKKKKTKNPEKLRKNQPAEPKPEVAAEEPIEEPVKEAVEEVAAETTTEETATDVAVEEPATEEPAEVVPEEATKEAPAADAEPAKEDTAA